MAVYEAYTSAVSALFEQVFTSQEGQLMSAASELALRISTDGIVHLFGTGHSHLIVEEAFYRAGGLACINPILEPNLMLHHGADQSTWLERVEGFASVILDKHRVRGEDAMIVISNSGRNAVPIEMAMEAKQRGLYTIAITSLNYRNEPSRHSSGLKLVDIADLVLDNFGPVGDAIVDMGEGIRMGATSTVIAAALVNALLVQTADNLKRIGMEPPIIQSVNGDCANAFERNTELNERYRARVRAL